MSLLPLLYLQYIRIITSTSRVVVRIEGTNFYKEPRTGWHRVLSQYYYFFPFINAKELLFLIPVVTLLSVAWASASRIQGTKSYSVSGYSAPIEPAEPWDTACLASQLWWYHKKFSNVTGNSLVWRGCQGTPHHPPEPHGPQRPLEKEI